MTKVKTFRKHAMASAVALAVGAPYAAAQDETEEKDFSFLEEVVVTATPRGKSILESSVAVTNVDAELIENFQPTNESELLRLIPGIQTAGQGGAGGNSNIAVRGLAVATGGSPFVQLQEDGLPVVLFGDIQFGNNDQWQRFDESVASVQAVRGGTAATFGSQGPGALVNYVSRTGEEEGGEINFSIGMGYDETRVGFRQGGALSDTVRYHVGGFFNRGEGVTEPGYDLHDSKQIKANITKDISGDGFEGYTRFNFKFASIKAPSFQDATPALANGDANGNISGLRALPGFDGRTDSFHSVQLSRFDIVGYDGDIRSIETNGIQSDQLAIGNELRLDFDNGLSILNKFRIAEQSGDWANIYLGVSRTDAQTGETYRYYNGANAGDAYTGEYVNLGTSNYTSLDDFGHFANDTTLTYDFELDAGTLSFTGGYFHFVQDIAAEWHPTQIITSVEENPVLLNAFSVSDGEGSGTQLTVNGQRNFNSNWGTGGCCARDYDATYTNTAPYAQVEFDADMFTVDASVRRDTIKASAEGRSGTQVDTITRVDNLTGNSVDVSAVTTLDGAQVDYANDSASYTSWTVGGLWKASDNMSLYARTSQGGRFNADRQLFGGNYDGDGKFTQQGSTSATNEINQHEVGIKARGDLAGGAYAVEFTLLQADYSVDSFQINTTGNLCPGGAATCITSQEFESEGFEFFGTYGIGGLDLVANMTYTDSTVQNAGSSDKFQPLNIPELQATFAANYDIMGQVNIGLTMSTSQDVGSGGQTVAEGLTTFGANVRYTPTEALEFSLVGNNITDEFGSRTNVNGAAGQQNQLVAGGIVLGAHWRLGVAYKF